MPYRNPIRTRTFRLITIGACTIGSFVIGLAATRFGTSGNVELLPAALVGLVMASFCALAAASSAASFFAGVDESVRYVHFETMHDKLTGLPSRKAMMAKIAAAANHTRSTGKPVFLVAIDINRFKSINDAIGYSNGDELVRCFAKRLQQSVPAGTRIGRIAAGEFALLIDDDGGERIDLFVNQLLDRMAKPYRLATHLQSVNLSIGIVSLPKDGFDPELLLRRSNLAIQHARASGIGGWAAYHPEMGEVADYRQWIESELQGAFERGGFALHYQPQHDLSTGQIVGYEALIRWNHPLHGMIPPDEFIPVAEETGMITQIGAWALRQACLDARRLPPECFVAVNISPVQFMKRDFVAEVAAVIAETGIAPSRLELEITETAMMQDRERAAAILKQLTAMGLTVAVDDFGTGYSNLSYLIDFSFHKLKIDQSFIQRINSDRNTGAIVSTIVGLSRALGVHTIAEGVETEHQATLLKAAGCNIVQGYYYGRPAPLPAETAVTKPQLRAVS